MYLTITTTHSPATDLGYLLHKRSGKLHSVSLSFDQAHVFYPEATDARCTAALLLEVDPVELVRKPGGPSGEGGLLDQYVNDRPYVSSSFTSVALARAFGTALGGRAKRKQELADTELPPGRLALPFSRVAAVKLFFIACLILSATQSLRIVIR
jgi:hypothetical protein